MNTSHFCIYDKATNETLATLPLTVPIGATVDAFELAGQSVGWRWASPATVTA